MEAKEESGEGERSGRVDDRAMIKHWVIAANLGHDDALEALGGAYTQGLVMPQLFVHTRLLWMKRKVLRGRRQKFF